jgi:hypothetical protein
MSDRHSGCASSLGETPFTWTPTFFVDQQRSMYCRKVTAVVGLGDARAWPVVELATFAEP